MAKDDFLRVSSLSLSAIAHSTEDPERVWKALLNATPREMFRSTVDERRLKGHYGNEIRVLKLLVGRSQAEESFDHLWRRLAPIDKESILDSVESHVDSERNLYLRIDKEDCFKGLIRLRESEPIKVQISFFKRGDSAVGYIDKVREKLGSLTK